MLRRGWRPRRGRYARGGVWHRRLFEAIIVGCVRTAGSAALHPRLLMARPLRGRSCCEGVMMGRRGRAIGGTPSWRPPRSVSDRGGGNIWHDGQCQARPRGCRPIGVALLITAGKRSAPADRLPTPFRPHGGRTSFRRRAGAWKRGTGPWRVTASRCPRVCLRHTRGNAKLDPYGVPLQGGSCPRVRLWLTRGYQRFDPYGVACLAVWLWGALVVPAAGRGASSRALDPYGVACLAVWLWGAVGSPCGRPRCIFAGVGPLWGPHIYALSVRGRAELTRGYRVVRPL